MECVFFNAWIFKSRIHATVNGVFCINMGAQCSFECLSVQIQNLCNCGLFGWQLMHCALHKLGVQWGVYFLMPESSNPEGIDFGWQSMHCALHKLGVQCSWMTKLSNPESVQLLMHNVWLAFYALCFAQVGDSMGCAVTECLNFQIQNLCNS